MWALRHAADVAEIYESRHLQEQVDALGLHDRAADIWRPLFAVALAAEDVELFGQLQALAAEMSPDPDRAEETRQLQVIRGLRSVAGLGETITGTTTQVADMLARVTDVSCSDLHGLLAGFGFSQQSARLEGLDTPRKVWHIQDEELAEIERGLTEGSIPPEAATTGTTTGTEGEAAKGGTDEPTRRDELAGVEG
ncbi:MAG: hypothetical protein ACYCW6_29705, partial [Candidatus Xenobia bacterium]